MAEPNLTCLENSIISDMELMMITITGLVSSSISLIICVLAILLMIVLKKYEFAIQRMIMYLIIAVLLNSIEQLLQRSSYKIIHENDIYCTGLAILGEYTSIAILLSINCIVFELFLRIVFKKEGGYIEIGYILIIFVLSLLLSWIPYFFNAYGPINSYCTIALSKNCDSYQTALILDTVLWWIPVYGTITFTLLAYPIFYYTIRKERRQTYNAVIKVDQRITSEKTLKEVGYFKWLPIIFIVLNMITIARNVYDFTEPDHPQLPLWIVATLVKGLQGGILALFATLDPRTVKRLTASQLRSAIRNNVFTNKDIQDYSVKYEKFSDSLDKTPSCMTHTAE